jgi:Na+-driven multidrug efflux pump
MEIFMSAKDTMENKITEGVIWKQLLLFFFPILVGTFFQQLYNTVDAGGLSEKRHYPASAVRPVRSSIWWSDFLPDYLPAQQL